MGLTDSRIGLILPMVAGSLPLSIFIFQGLLPVDPRELMDAAKVDGCTEFSAFLRVVVPISGPAIATVAILEFVGAWNQYFLALVLLRSPEMRTIPLAIQVFFYAWGRTEWAAGLRRLDHRFTAHDLALYPHAAPVHSGSHRRLGQGVACAAG